MPRIFRSRRAPTPLGLLAVTLAFCLGIGEIAVRLLAPDHRGLHVHPGRVWRSDLTAEDRLGVYDELLGWALRRDAEVMNEAFEFRHTVRTNARGFRSSDVPHARTPGRRRVVVLGDSFAMGDGVEWEDTFVSRLERALGNVEFVNLGVNGYGTDQEVLLFERDGVRYDPDLVLLVFTVSNDVFNNVSRTGYGLNKPWFTIERGDSLVLNGVPVPYHEMDGVKVPVAADVPMFPVHDWLDSRSGLYALAFHHLTRVEAFRARWEGSGLLHQQIAVLYSEQLEILESPPRARAAKGWYVTELLLARLARAVRDSGAELTIMAVPNQLQVHAALWRRAVAERGLVAARYDVDGPLRALEAIAGRISVPTIDVVSALRDAATSSSLPLYYHRNPHWTRIGHDVVADAMGPRIEALLAERP